MFFGYIARGYCGSGTASGCKCDGCGFDLRLGDKLFKIPTIVTRQMEALICAMLCKFYGKYRT